MAVNILYDPPYLYYVNATLKYAAGVCQKTAFSSPFVILSQIQMRHVIQLPEPVTTIFKLENNF